MKIHSGFPRWHIEGALQRSLPSETGLYTDVYFTRTLQVLKALELNPWVAAQVFVRRVVNGKTGVVDGINEVLAVFAAQKGFFENGGHIWAVPNGSKYESCDTLLQIVGRLQDFVELETIYLGLLSGRMTDANMGPFIVDESGIMNRIRAIRGAMRISPHGERPVVYFGARHYPWWLDPQISQLCWDAGAKGTSTKSGSTTRAEAPRGTVPHVAEIACAHRFGWDEAVPITMETFDHCVDPHVRRVTLPDVRNLEITDTIATKRRLGDRLYGTRSDTNGALLAQGAARNRAHARKLDWYGYGEDAFPAIGDALCEYWFGNGVTVTGSIALFNACKAEGLSVEQYLTSGFANPNKARAFSLAEAAIGQKLFDSIGVGEVQPAIFATMDVCGVGDSLETMKVLHKAGRPPRPNKKLIRAMGEFPNKNPYRFVDKAT